MEQPTFKISHPALEGFADHYAKEVLPFLEENEDKRLQAVKKTKIGVSVFAVLTVLTITYFFRQDPEPRAVFLPLVGFFAASFALYAFLTHKLQKATKEKIVGSICAFVGWSFNADVEKEPELSGWRAMGLLPRGKLLKLSQRISFEDHMKGPVGKSDFEAMEIHIEERHDKSWRTVMRGQLMSLTFPRKFLGTTVVLRDQKLFQSKKMGDMKRVGLVDPVFERIFEAYGTDQVEARYLLTPTFMQKLVDLEASVSGEKIRFGFREGRLLIVVETENQFEAGSMLSPLASSGRTQKVLNEIGAIFHLVEGVMEK